MGMLKRIVKNEEGYGTVELLVLVAALGFLATTFMKTMSGRVEDSSNSVADNIDDLVADWTTSPE